MPFLYTEQGGLYELYDTQMPPKTIPQGYDAHPVRRDDEHRDKQYDDHYGGHRKKQGFLRDLFD
jgi:Zn-finger nucleic acid-binding protein